MWHRDREKAMVQGTSRNAAFVSNSGCIIVILAIWLFAPTVSFRAALSIRRTIYDLRLRYPPYYFPNNRGSTTVEGQASGPWLDDPQTTPWKRATIDYSGANEYVHAHYGSLASSLWEAASVPYFSKGDTVTEPIYDARKVLSSNTTEGSHHQWMLQNYGMTLVDDSPTDMMNWENHQEIERVYIRELERLLPSLFSSKIYMHCFWNPMRRGESLALSPPGGEGIPTANVASMVHIDTDVGAYESLDEFLAIIETNRVVQKDAPDLFDRELCQTAISKQKKRFAVINFWRNTNRKEAVGNRPLAMLSTRYHDNDRGRDSLSAFPNRRPDNEKSKWYAFPNMTNEELLVFYQYDRLVSQPSDIWHCAISIHDDDDDSTHNTKTCAPRESFDIRALVVFEDSVPPEKDRFGSERVRPVLSFEESGCFCDEQASKRTQ